MAIVFGSPEAQRILARDKELQRADGVDMDWFRTAQEEIEELQDRIDNLENEECPNTGKTYLEVLAILGGRS